MSCQIIYLNELGQEIERYWVETEVLRIGSDSSCQVLIAGLPRHALTLQFRDQAYAVINRGEEALEIDGHGIAPQASVPWPENATLRFGNGIALRLTFPDGDPTPSPRASKRPYYDIEEAESSEPAEPPSATPAPDDEEEVKGTKVSGKTIKNAVQATITGLCLFAAVLLLVFQDRLKSPKENKALAPFSKIVEGLIQQEKQVPALVSIRAALQDGRRLEVAGRIELARASYQRVRDLLLERVGHQGPLTFDSDAERDAYEYALEHLTRVQGSSVGSE